MTPATASVSTSGCFETVAAWSALVAAGEVVRNSGAVSHPDLRAVPVAGLAV
ncbi:MAG: hypothetical protein M3Y26_10015 [Actinomycetota bacterium]|nr:hypothetical protein [Actinomycetota bacterium]